MEPRIGTICRPAWSWRSQYVTLDTIGLRISVSSGSRCQLFLGCGSKLEGFLSRLLLLVAGMSDPRSGHATWRTSIVIMPCRRLADVWDWTLVLAAAYGKIELLSS